MARFLSLTLQAIKRKVSRRHIHVASCFFLGQHRLSLHWSNKPHFIVDTDISVPAYYSLGQALTFLYTGLFLSFMIYFLSLKWTIWVRGAKLGTPLNVSSGQNSQTGTKIYTFQNFYRAMPGLQQETNQFERALSFLIRRVVGYQVRIRPGYCWRPMKLKFMSCLLRETGRSVWKYFSISA